MFLLFFLFFKGSSIDANSKNYTSDAQNGNMLITENKSLEDQNFFNQFSDKNKTTFNLTKNQNKSSYSTENNLFSSIFIKFRNFIKYFNYSPIPVNPPIYSQGQIYGSSPVNLTPANIDQTPEKGMIFGIPNSIFMKVIVIASAIVVTLFGVYVLYLACQSTHRHVTEHYSDDPLLVEPADTDTTSDFT